MRFLHNLVATVKHWLLRARKSNPADIPRKLDKETLEKAMQEARFLFFQHSVDVKSLAPGEVPDLPKRADD